MTFDSVYEMTNPLTTVRKQHFWEYFSGSKLPSGNSFINSSSDDASWGSRGSQTSISSGVVTTNFGATDDDSAVYRTLDNNIVGDFELRIKHRFTSYTSSTSGIVALADRTDTIYNPVTAGSNSVMIGINSDSSGAHSFAFYSVENGVFTNHGDAPISTGRSGTVSHNTDYWLKMTKVGNLVTINVYNNSSYSGTVVTSCYGSVSATFPSTLNSIQIGMAWTMSGRGASWTNTDLSITYDSTHNRWDKTVVGSSTGAMDDDGGYKITTGTSNDDLVQLDFNDINQFSHNASEVIAVWKGGKSGATYENISVGLMNATYALTGVNQAGWVLDNSISSNTYFMKCGNSGGVGYVWSTVPYDTSYHVFKSSLSGSGMTGSIDGVAVGTTTTNLPNGSMQPHIHRQYKSDDGVARILNIKYFEAYNT